MPARAAKYHLFNIVSLNMEELNIISIYISVSRFGVAEIFRWLIIKNLSVIRFGFHLHLSIIKYDILACFIYSIVNDRVMGITKRQMPLPFLSFIIIILKEYSCNITCKVSGFMNLVIVCVLKRRWHCVGNQKRNKFKRKWVPYIWFSARD